MKFIYFLMFLMTLNTSIAQVPGLPLIDNTSEWHFQGTAWYFEFTNCNQDFAVEDSYITYYIQGDTMINSQTYLKMYQERIDSNYCSSNPAIQWVDVSDNFRSFIREENNRIFTYNPSMGTEELFYDYNTIGIGTTLSSDCVVSSIDTLYLLYQPYLKYNCGCTYNNSEFLIQGIGTKRYFFASLNCGVGIEGDWVNKCYTKNGFTISIDAMTSCISTGDTTLYVDVNEVSEQTERRIYPNPSDDKIKVEIDKGLIEKYAVYAIDGRKLLFSDHINSAELSLDLTNLEKGVYIIVFELNNGQVFGEKIVKTGQ